MKKILFILMASLLFAGCETSVEHVDSYEYTNEAHTVKILGTGFECTGKIFDDHLGYKTHTIGIICNDGTVVHNLNNYIVVQ